MTPTLELPRISSASLKDWDTCKRRFALRYRVGRYWPGPQARDLDPEASERILTGQVFHRMVQQHALGLDVTPVLEAEKASLSRLEQLWGMFARSTHAKPPANSWTEAPLHFQFKGVPFMVRFDRLVKEGDNWCILDWKTGKENRAILQASWQTRLYRFALVEAGHVYHDGEPIQPENIRMVYWDVNRGREEAFAYDGASYETDRRDFERLTEAVMAPFDEGAPDDPRFPRPLDPTVCARCAFDSYCNPTHARRDEAERTLPLPSFSLEDRA
ncbi:PD-(D/E)XK nuclease family protein [bacterium]|nr:PD-(D/E)XK nuclease family protein [bacterium]